MKTVRQEQLDFLRGIAATYVVINHVRGHFFVGGKALLAGHPSWTDYLAVAALQFTSFGQEMVILFFVLSGFAMAHSVQHSSSVQRFYLKRILRIWPPYIAAVVLAALVGLMIGAPINPWPMLFYVHASTPLTPQFWSLPYEVVFYALCPFVMLRRRWFFWVAALATIATLLSKGPLLNPWRAFPLDFLGNEMLLFAIGALAYRNYQHIPEVSRRALLLVVAIAVPVVWAFRYLSGDSNLVGDIIVTGVTVLAIRNLPDRIPKWANLGFFSYSIYIFHFALMAVLMWAFWRFGIDVRKATNPFLWPLAVPPILLGCFALYWATERISNGWVRSLRRDRLHDREIEHGLLGRRAAGSG